MYENGLGASLRERLSLRVNEAAAVTGLSRSTLYVLMRKGALRSVRVAGRRLIPRDPLEALLQGGK
jgi:excisionase family DNA binding protein